jgi:hypothetical protein
MTKTELLDDLMKKPMHCPYYGREAAGCDVGRGYVSVSVVHRIANHCSSRYAGSARRTRRCSIAARCRIATKTPAAAPPQPESTGGTCHKT